MPTQSSSYRGPHVLLTTDESNAIRKKLEGGLLSDIEEQHLEMILWKIRHKDRMPIVFLQPHA